jgi:transcriptional regulator with XRE-family HTH domain
MATRSRTSSQLEGDLEARAIAATLGAEVRRTRRARRLTQAALAARVGWRQARIGEIERGEGDTAPLGAWVRLGKALGRPLAVMLSRDTGGAGPADAGHLAAQELLLRLARSTGRTGLFELPTRPGNPSRSVDVGIRDDRNRVLILAEIWNRLDDLGAAARSTARKTVEAEALAMFRTPAYRVAICWLFVDSPANRSIVRRFPEILRSRFRGSSARWARFLVDGSPPPDATGLCWIDPRSGTIRPMRLSR